MKKLFITLLITFGITLFSQPISAQSVNNFTIDSFEADYYLSKDEKNVSLLKVVEKIVAQFPDYDQNHGIERAIPKKYKGNNLNVEIGTIETRGGESWTFSTREQKDNLILRIGNADRYVRGEQTYIITYTMRDVITFYDTYDEWYWDVNGDQWQQPFNEVVARLHIPTPIASEITKQPICFTGTYGGAARNCTVDSNEDANETVISIATSRQLEANENMSFVIGFKQGTFTKYKADPKMILLGALLAGGAVLLPPLITLGAMYKKWKVLGKDPEGRGVIVPQYKPQAGMNPLIADVVMTEQLSDSAISSAILELCISGYLKLYEVTKKKILKDGVEYEIEIIKIDVSLSPLHKKVLEIVFGATYKAGDKINLNQQKNKLYSGVTSLRTLVNEQVATAGYFQRNPAKARTMYATPATLMLISGIACFFVLRPWLIPLAIGLISSAIITFIFGSRMPARTLTGVEAKEYLLGLKDYMNLAEKDRIAYLQGPDTAEKIDVKDSKKMVKLYEALLPYAMLFGIEKEWVKQFADLYAEGQSPSWYSGRSAFNAVVFSNAVSGFNSASASSFTAPSSSGSSGFSGGGFSGGGGGGGGGGGW